MVWRFQRICQSPVVGNTPGFSFRPLGCLDVCLESGQMESGVCLVGLPDWDAVETGQAGVRGFGRSGMSAPPGPVSIRASGFLFDAFGPSEHRAPSVHPTRRGASRGLWRFVWGLEVWIIWHVCFTRPGWGDPITSLSSHASSPKIPFPFLRMLSPVIDR